MERKRLVILIVAICLVAYCTGFVLLDFNNLEGVIIFLCSVLISYSFDDGQKPTKDERG